MRRIILMGMTIVMVSGVIWFSFGQGLLESTKKSNKREQTETEVIANDEPKAPNFTLNSLDGTKDQLLSKNKPTIINFWASWCSPCKMEMPILQKAYDQYKDQLDFRMVNVTVDDNRKQMQQLMRQKGYTFPVLLDETGKASEIYQIMSLPTTFVVDQNGQIVKRVLGAMTEPQLDKIITSLLTRKD